MVPRKPFSCAAVRRQAEINGIYLHFLPMDILRKQLALSRQGRLQACMPDVCTRVMMFLSCAIHINGRHRSLPGHRFPLGQPSLLPSHTLISRKLKYKLPNSHYWGLFHSQPHSFAGDLKPSLAAGRGKAKCDSCVPKSVQQSEQPAVTTSPVHN